MAFDQRAESEAAGERKAVAKMIFSGALFLLAGWLAYSHWRQQKTYDDAAFFYDLSERKLFVGPRSAVPPIKGINDDELDGVRAVVVSTSGAAKDESNRRIVYLEKYSAEFQQQVAAMRAATPGASTGAVQIGRSEAKAHTFVRRLNDEKWYPLTSPEAEKILTEWWVRGPDGHYPVVCVP